MKLLFIDIDGVFNYEKCKYKAPSGCYGIDDNKVKLLQEIIGETGAIVVLTSTWKTEWFRTQYIEDLSKDGQYLVRQFGKYRIFIYDKTEDPSWAQRGEGILNFMKNYPYSIESFAILDDESFDFEELGLTNHFVKTNFKNGLLPEHVKQVIHILNGT